jgi:hypothetical protein
MQVLSAELPSMSELTRSLRGFRIGGLLSLRFVFEPVGARGHDDFVALLFGQAVLAEHAALVLVAARALVHRTVAATLFGALLGDEFVSREVGEVVVTSLVNTDYPMIRFGTGDLSAVLAGTCPTGRTNKRIKGWLGRADQTTKVRGMFVHPSQVAEIARRFPEIQRARLVVSGEMGDDQMNFRLECAGAPEGLVVRIAEAVREVTKLRGTIELVAPGSLPNDGKVIEDARSYK